MEKRPYYNQAQKLCPQYGEWKIHTRGRKYYTCLTCGLRTLKAQANNSVQRTAGDPPEIVVGFVNKMLEEKGGG